MLVWYVVAALADIIFSNILEKGTKYQIQPSGELKQ